MKIPVATVNIGPVHKRDVMKCSTQLQHDAKYAMILAFDVKVIGIVHYTCMLCAALPRKFSLQGCFKYN
jgi:translation initiation factor IF-2